MIDHGARSRLTRSTRCAGVSFTGTAADAAVAEVDEVGDEVGDDAADTDVDTAADEVDREAVIRENADDETKQPVESVHETRAMR